MLTRPNIVRTLPPVTRILTCRSLTIPFLKTIPQPPGYIVGSVNEPAALPPRDKLHGSTHWTGERVIAIGLVPLVATAFSTHSLTTSLDVLFSVLLLGHSYVGFESCIVDYVPKRVYGKYHNYTMHLLQFGSVVSLVGIYDMCFNDKGLIGFIKEAWKSDSGHGKRLFGSTVEYLNL